MGSGRGTQILSGSNHKRTRVLKLVVNYRRSLGIFWVQYLFLYVALMSSPGALLAQENHAAGHAQHDVYSKPKKQSQVGNANGPSASTRESNVLTVRYHCASQGSDSCAITVTRSEFDALVQAIDPKMTADSRQSLAAEYSRLLIMATEARRRGIDQSPEMQTLLKFSALQVLATGLVREIAAHPPAVTPTDVERYFHEHQQEYEEVVLSRILVPSKTNDTEQNGITPAQRAAAVRARAVNGEDFAALQREMAGASGTAASKVRMGPLPCQSLPETHRPICDLQLGEISMPLADGQEYVIYKLESRHVWSLNEVREHIHTKLEQERVQAEIHKVRTPVALELDEGYFGALPKPDVAEHHGMHMPPVKSTGPSESTPHQH